LALVTDFDCWHVEEEPVTLEAVLEIMHKNVEQSQLVLKELIPMLGSIKPCSCCEAAKFAVVTDPEKIPQTLKDELSILFG
jgi:5'-methylthioadenosine phosphorylase